MVLTLRPYQEESIKRLLRSHSGLDASEMGTGKTLVGTELLRAMGIQGRVPRVLIIAPVNTHRQWVNSFAGQYPKLAGSKYLRVVGTAKSDPESWAMMTKRQPGVYIITWEAMRGTVPKRLYGHLYDGNKVTVRAIKAAMKDGYVPPWTRTGTWDLVIADESHRLKNKGSTNKKVIKMIKSNRRHASSGTPAGNKPEGLWSTLNWLWPEEYKSFWDWAERYLIVKETKIGYNETRKEIIGEKHPGSAISDVPAYVRWLLDEVSDQLPDVIEKIQVVSMGPNQREQYEGFAADAFAWIEANQEELDTQGLTEDNLESHPVFAALPVSRRIRMRQAALGQLNARQVMKAITAEDGTKENVLKLELDFVRTGEQPKVQAIKDILDDLPENEPLLVFSHSAKWAVMAAELLDQGYGPARAWTGALTKKQRDDLKDAFGASVRILVAQIAALAEGVDGLQYKARCEVWASPSDDGVINMQAMKRIHRPGQKNTVIRWLLHSEDSIDDAVKGTLDLQSDVTGGMYVDEQKRARVRAKKGELV